jgi:hypothetical protein
VQTTQIRWTPDTRWSGEADDQFRDADLVLVFGDSPHFQTAHCFQELRQRFPDAVIVGCSSSGSVQGSSISDADVVATAILLERGRVHMAAAHVDANAADGVRGLAAGLMGRLKAPDLRHVLVFSDGLLVNGSDLAAGLNGYGISVTGGLAGDGTRFGKTWVMADAPARSGAVAAVGLYGDLSVKSGCFAGWQEFGAERTVTRSAGNVVMEIDNQPALALYKKYLGELASDLPGSGLRFPLSVRAHKDEQPVIRTLLGVDEDAQSLTFAGDVPQGNLCKLMKTNLDRLIENAGLAAGAAKHRGTALLGASTPDGLCLVVSCVGRRLVLGQLTEEEIEVVQDTLGEHTAITGFYSYGELAPFSDIQHCRLHNQTMTLTTVYE